MSDRRAFGRMTAIGGFFAGVVLLICGPSARAGELSGQNTGTNLFLQHRLDQLDAGQPTAGPTPPPGAPATQGGFPRSYRIPGTDTTIRVYGTVSETLSYSNSR
jgi:hypothetical protein